MDVSKMIGLATETMLDLDEIKMQFLNAGRDCSPELKAADEQYYRLYESLKATLNEEQRKMLLAMDDSFGARLAAKNTFTLASGVIVGLKYAGWSDDRIKAALAAVLPDLETVKQTRKDIDKLAREIVDKRQVSLSDNPSSKFTREDIDRLRDAAFDGWREAEKKAAALYAEIKEKTPLIDQYDECRNVELGVDEDVFFSLGFATAVRLLGR